MHWKVCYVIGFGLIALTLVTGGVEGKRKRKFDGDFEFAEEEESKLKNSIFTGKKAEGKKTWILDAGSDLCQALKCKSKELCLLEDEFTAVCVSKKEINRNGDVVIPRSKVNFKEPKVVKKVQEEEDEYSDEYSDYDDSDMDDLDDDDEDSDEDFEFGKEKSSTTPSSSSSSVDAFKSYSNNYRSCSPCPVVKPVFLCATDNRTYSSLCRLDYHNCLQNTKIQVSCKGFCPCKGVKGTSGQRTSSKKKSGVWDKAASWRLEEESVEGGKKEGGKMDRYSKYKDSNYKKTSSDKQRSFNDVLDMKKNNPQREVEDCSEKALESMGDRLLDWFSVVHADTLKRKLVRKTKNSQVRFPRDCKKEVQFMFGHLNSDDDDSLSLKELFNLENDRSEPCIKSFIDRCDSDKDVFVSGEEWCRCFSKADRPCNAIRRKTTKGLLGGYLPQCEVDGFYKPLQCHSSTGLCWCVDKHGVEYANTRTRGKPSCSSLGDKENSKNDRDDDDDEDAYFEGSGDN